MQVMQTPRTIYEQQRKDKNIQRLTEVSQEIKRIQNENLAPLKEAYTSGFGPAQIDEQLKKKLPTFVKAHQN